MTIVQMLYFSTVCQYMNLTRAAQKLHISQPALSAVIKQIEAECGVMLFQHRANSIGITDEGVVLLQEIEPLLQQYRHLETQITGKHLNRNYIRIGVSPILGTGIMTEISSLFKRRHQEIRLHLIEEGIEQLYDDLDQGNVDLIIAAPRTDMTEEELESFNGYSALRLRNMDMVFAVSINHPLAQQEQAEWADIVSRPLILLDESFDMVHMIEERMVQDGYQLPVNSCFTSQVYTAMTLIEANIASGFMPSETVRHNSRVRGLPFPGCSDYPIYLISRRDNHQFQSVQKYVATAREFISGAAQKPDQYIQTTRAMERE